MQKYTGANLKQRALMLLADLSIDTTVPPIYVQPQKGHVYLFFRAAGVSLRIDGVLPLSDLPEIEAALKENETLCKNYKIARERELFLNKAQNDLREERSAFIDAAIKKESATSPEVVNEITRKTYILFAPKFEAIAAEIRQYNALASPGYYKADNPHTYIADFAARAEQASGISQDAEEALLKPSEEWVQEWDKFIEEMKTPAPQSLMMLRALKSQSSVYEIFESRAKAVEVLRRIGDPSAIFTPEALDASLEFSNKMALKCAPFVEQAVAPAETVAEQDEEVEQESSRPG